MYRDLLESFADGVTILTPEGLVLDINQRPLTDAHLRREEVIGKPLTDLPAWSSARQSNSNCAQPLHKPAREKPCALRPGSIHETDCIWTF